jgi:hypothetical protein
LPFSQDESGLKVPLPQQPPCENAVCFKIAGAIRGA